MLGKTFCTLDDGTSVIVKTSREEQATLLAADPETFTIPPYVGRHG